MKKSPGSPAAGTSNGSNCTKPKHFHSPVSCQERYSTNPASSAFVPLLRNIGFPSPIQRIKIAFTGSPSQTVKKSEQFATFDDLPKRPPFETNVNTLKLPGQLLPCWRQLQHAQPELCRAHWIGIPKHARSLRSDGKNAIVAPSRSGRLSRRPKQPSLSKPCKECKPSRNPLWPAQAVIKQIDKV